MIEVPYGRVPYPLDIGPFVTLLDEALRRAPREKVVLDRLTEPGPRRALAAHDPSDGPSLDRLSWLRPCAGFPPAISSDVTSLTSPRYQARPAAAIAPHAADPATPLGWRGSHGPDLPVAIAPRDADPATLPFTGSRIDQLFYEVAG